MNIINAKSVLTEKDYINTYRYMQFEKISTKILLFLLPISFIFGIFTFSASLNLSIFLIFFSLVMIYFLFIFPIFTIKKQFKLNIKLLQEVFWTFSEEEVFIKITDITEKWKWSEFKNYKIKNQYILLYLLANKNMAKIIPKKAFETEDDYNNLIKLCELKFKK